MSSNLSKKKPTGTARSGGKPTVTEISGVKRPVSASKMKGKPPPSLRQSFVEKHMTSNEEMLLDQASELRAEINRLGEANERLKAKLSKNEQVEKSDNRRHLEKQLSDLKNENEDIKVTIKEKNAEILKLQKDLKDANEQNRGKPPPSLRQSLVEKHMTSNEEMLLDQASELRAEINRLGEANERLKAKLSKNEQVEKRLKLQKDLKDANEQNRQKDDIEKRTAPTDNKLTDLTRELNDANQKCKEAESEVEKLQYQLSSKAKDILHLNRKIAEWKSENEGLKEKISKPRDEEQLNSKSEEIESLRKELETLKMALSKQNSTDQQAQGRNTNFEKDLKEKDESIFNQYGEQPGSEQFKMPTSQILPSVSDSFTESMSALSVRGPGDDDSFIVADDTERLAEASFAGDSDERIKVPCAVCFTNRNYSKEATHFCGECGLLGHFLCEQCLSFHKKFSPHKDVKSFAAAKYKMLYA